MRAGCGISGGRLPRGSIFAEMKRKGSALHDTPGLAVPLIMQGFTPDGHRDSSLCRKIRMPRNV